MGVYNLCKNNSVEGGISGWGGGGGGGGGAYGASILTPLEGKHVSHHLDKELQYLVGRLLFCRWSTVVRDA